MPISHVEVVHDDSDLDFLLDADDTPEAATSGRRDPVMFDEYGNPTLEEMEKLFTEHQKRLKAAK